MTRVRTKRELVRDCVLYIAVAVALVGSILWGAARDLNKDRFFLGLLTIFVFGFVIGRERQLVSLTRFWLVMAGLLALHLVVVARVLRHVAGIRAVWLGAFGFAEIVLITAAVEATCARPLPRRRARP